MATHQSSRDALVEQLQAALDTDDAQAVTDLLAIHATTLKDAHLPAHPNYHAEFRLIPAHEWDPRAGIPPLHYACAASARACVEALIQGGCDVNAMDTHGLPPLFAATQAECLEAVEMLLAAGAEVNPESDLSLLSLALMTDNAEKAPRLVQTLVDAGATVGRIHSFIVTEPFEAPMHLLAHRGGEGFSLEAAREMGYALMAAGADINAPSMCYGTPLEVACRFNPDMVAPLVELGASPVHAEDEGVMSSAYMDKVPLMITLFTLRRNPPEAAMRALVDAGVAIDERLPGDTLNHKECEPTVLQLLVGEGGASAKAVQTLLSLGGDVEARDNAGDTLLHYAARALYPDPAVVEVLLAAGADPFAVNDAGDMAGDCVHLTNSERIWNQVGATAERFQPTLSPQG